MTGRSFDFIQTAASLFKPSNAASVALGLPVNQNVPARVSNANAFACRRRPSGGAAEKRRSFLPDLNSVANFLPASVAYFSWATIVIGAVGQVRRILLSRSISRS